MEAKYGKIFPVVLFLLQFHIPISFVCLISDGVLLSKGFNYKMKFSRKVENIFLVPFRSTTTYILLP